MYDGVRYGSPGVKDVRGTVPWASDDRSVSSCLCRAVGARSTSCSRNHSQVRSRRSAWTWASVSRVSRGIGLACGRGRVAKRTLSPAAARISGYSSSPASRRPSSSRIRSCSDCPRPPAKVDGRRARRGRVRGTRDEVRTGKEQGGGGPTRGQRRRRSRSGRRTSAERDKAPHMGARPFSARDAACEPTCRAGRNCLQAPVVLAARLPWATGRSGILGRPGRYHICAIPRPSVAPAGGRGTAVPHPDRGGRP